MHLVEQIIGYLEQQIECAPRLEMADIPSYEFDPAATRWREAILDRLTESAGKAGMSSVTPDGRNAYTNRLQKAVVLLAPVAQFLSDIENRRTAMYRDSEAERNAMKQAKPLGDKIADACKAGIAELKQALAVIEAGERLEMQKLGVK